MIAERNSRSWQPAPQRAGLRFPSRALLCPAEAAGFQIEGALPQAELLSACRGSRLPQIKARGKHALVKLHIHLALPRGLPGALNQLTIRATVRKEFGEKAARAADHVLFSTHAGSLPFECPYLGAPVLMASAEGRPKLIALWPFLVGELKAYGEAR